MTAAADVVAAARTLTAGGLVAFPTETVYGLGADATNAVAVRRLFEVKGRPADHPLIVHVGAIEDLDRYGRDVSDTARRLAGAFWPGPLTIIVPKGRTIAAEATAGRDTVGLRMPSHPVALALLAAFGGPVAAPSANRFGRVSPTTAQHVRDDLGTDVTVVLDGGPCPIGVESTIVEALDDRAVLLRPGAIGVEEIQAACGVEVRPDTSGPSRASGMLESHYAPRCRVVLANDRAEATALTVGCHAKVEILAPDATAEQWAHSLYAWLREIDRRGVDVLVVVMPGGSGVATAVRDRLTKAAAPRD